MRVSTLISAVGALALTALIAPTAHATVGGSSDIRILSATVNGGKDIVIGTTTKTITATVTSTAPSNIKNVSLVLFHGTHLNTDDFDGVLNPTSNQADCRTVNGTTSTCKLTISGNPTLLKNATAGTWKAYISVVAKDGSWADADPYSSVRIQRKSLLTVNASPEPVGKGKTITIAGKLSRASWWDDLEYHGYANQPVKLQFRKAGTATYTTVKTTYTDSSGNLKTTVRASVDGYWRYWFAGTTTTPEVKAAGDYVDVR
ncbi:calcium-binding protein [Streptomyces sp. NPDC086549]|uniref:calcium-binding protein n=1 Tax=Streptomyces sp. NPDC086549 TaxID=3365752 RepID=UPI00382E2E82